MLGVVFCCINVLSFTSLNIITRYLKKPHFAALVSLQQYINLLILIPVYFTFCDIPSVSVLGVFLLALVGAARFVSTVSFTRAAQQAMVSKIAFVNYLQSPIGYVFDYLCFQYALQISDVFLIALVTAASVFMYYRSHTSSS